MNNYLNVSNYKSFFGQKYNKPFYLSILSNDNKIHHRNTQSQQQFRNDQSIPIAQQYSLYQQTIFPKEKLKSNIKTNKTQTQNQQLKSQSSQQIQPFTPIPLNQYLSSNPYEFNSLKLKLKSGRNLFSRIKQRGIKFQKFQIKQQEIFIKNSLKSKLLAINDQINDNHSKQFSNELDIHRIQKKYE